MDVKDAGVILIIWCNAVLMHVLLMNRFFLSNFGIFVCLKNYKRG